MYRLTRMLAVVFALPLCLRAQALKTCPPPSISPAAFAQRKFDYVIIGTCFPGCQISYSYPFYQAEGRLVLPLRPGPLFAPIGTTLVVFKVL